ncbi:hypothetical protein PENTCL1PPCAC_5917, partial [Pristionchus entomophagus]
HHRRSTPFDKNDRKYRITTCCCLHVRIVIRILAILFFAFALNDCLTMLKSNQFYPDDSISELYTFFMLAAHIGIQILIFVAIPGESKTALMLLMTLICAFAIFFLISQLVYFQKSVEYYLTFFLVIKLIRSSVSIFNGTKIILVILLLIYTLRIVHYYTCYIAGKDRNQIIPIVYFETKEETVTTALDGTTAAAEGEA